ncbi:cytochrome c biogenesis heme-transporting ATPase CcmA [Aliivibrio sp. EL58]|uniref:Cytochrome c biogenesis ATP-binding export protein CcmA n=1 Tax=Aliivibrio wodanis TaxID=80852 RepID=A0A090KKC1_9GAMM|nr:cytochrome c biogenesis heme-transporting ATPase CcmA [Aliivibrio sp. EL58]CED72009.1 cytochrome c biogenesis ATP-binding export protein CcmA [Aliivibrio wodanis]VVV04730.1 Cytochrome c biogenesis ATP-binding export protein CcmA [Aliivibrio wodanis]
MLEIRNVTCIRDERVLFEQLSFTISDGELIQIEGQNGAGKTTLLRIIAGLGYADEGDIYWNGESIKKNREEFHSDLLFLGHHTGVKRELTAFENLAFYQSMHSNYNEEAIWDALARVGLAGREDVAAGQLSAGQQRRVALARLWLSNHKLWVLDEPLTAIDKQGVKVLEQLFMSHAKQGGIVLLTTHQDLFTDSNELKKIRLGE